MNKERNKIVEIIANFNDEVGDMFLSEQFVPASKLRAAIRKVLVSKEYEGQIAPVLMGSSFRNKGVQPLIDSVIDFLPSPIEKQPVHSHNDKDKVRKPEKSEHMVGYVFKTIYDLEKGPLSFTRIYSGNMKRSNEVYNSNKKMLEKSNRYIIQSLIS